MKVFVASSFSNKAEVDKLNADLIADGYELTHDWTGDEKTHDLITLQQHANDCLVGATKAEVLIMLARPNSVGSWIEVGAAIYHWMVCLQCKNVAQAIILVGGGNDIYESLPFVARVEDVAAAQKWLHEFREGKRKHDAGLSTLEEDEKLWN